MISYLWLGLGSLIRWAKSLLIRSWLPKRLLLLLLNWGWLLLRWACCLWLLGRKLLTDRLGRLLERLPELLGESWLLLAERLLLLHQYFSKEGKQKLSGKKDNQSFRCWTIDIRYSGGKKYPKKLTPSENDLKF